MVSPLLNGTADRARPRTALVLRRRADLRRSKSGSGRRATSTRKRSASAQEDGVRWEGSAVVRAASRGVAASERLGRVELGRATGRSEDGRPRRAPGPELPVDEERGTASAPRAGGQVPPAAR